MCGYVSALRVMHAVRFLFALQLYTVCAYIRQENVWSRAIEFLNIYAHELTLDIISL